MNPNTPSVPAHPELPHATERLPAWRRAWRRSGRLVLLLDFDGTLAPIVERPELARPTPAAVAAVERLQRRDDVTIAVISGRGLRDARSLAGFRGITFAGNHGMEIEGPGIDRVHPEAAAARPRLERVANRLADVLGGVDGALVEDKGLTLSVHFRQVAPERVSDVERMVDEATRGDEKLRVTHGKKVLEIRPRVDWHKGRAVEFLLEHLEPPTGTPAVYLGDDTTDEDAFAALERWTGGGGEGVLVAERPRPTAARSRVRDPDEVAGLLGRFADSLDG